VDVYPFFRRNPLFGDAVNAVTVMNIRIASLTAILEELRFSPDVMLDIVDENGIQVASTHRADVASAAFTIEEGRSDFFNFSYRASIPRSFFDDRTRPISRFIVIMSIILTAVNGIVAYGISRGLYHPVSRIMNAIIKPGSQSDIDQRSEFAYIQEAVNSYINTNTRLRTFIEQERDPISFNLLRNLFEHSVISRESLERSLEIIGITIDHDHFTVLAVESVEPDVAAELLPRLLRLTVREAVNETAESFELSAVPAAIQNNRFHILLMSDVSSPRHQSMVREFAEGLIEKLSRRLETSFVGSLGPSEQRAHLVSISYREANAALDQKFFRSADGPILDYVDTMSYSKSFLFPEVEISRIIEITFSNDTSGIDAQLDVIFSLFESHTLSESAIKSVVNHLIFVLATKLRERKEDLSGVFQNGNELISELEHITSVRSLKTWLRDLLVHTAHAVHENLSRYSIQVETAMDFIKRNYMNLISLSDVADALNISSQYLSKIFKDETGYNYIDFLNEIRLEKAYALVVDTDLLIKDIAMQTGFSNSQYLIKRFKAKYGVTPSHLR
ncbi:MAG: helix-turn-helix transcriptional regulator, partial [Spirochaetales bacterium]|nr:helix-turn-helix transcriptional regulator [Spirochaetales bacterium]